MSLLKRQGSPYWYAEFEIAKRRFCLSTKTTSHREAQQVERRFKEEAREKLREESQKQNLLLDHAFGQYWKEYSRKLAPAWASEVQRYCTEILRITPEKLTIEEMDDSHVNDYVQARVDEDAGDYAINRALSVWSRVHNIARKTWKRKVNVIDWAHFKNSEKKRIKELTDNEVKRLLSKASPSLALAIEWSIYTGCRREETFSLTWAQVFFDKGYATVRAKGGRDHRVWLSPNALDVLARCEQRGRYVFERTNWRRAWEGCVKAAGFDDLRWHDLRHVHATWLRQAGVPLEVVQRSLGHADIQTTMRYAHVSDHELQAALHKLPTLAPHTKTVVSIFSAKTGGYKAGAND